MLANKFENSLAKLERRNLLLEVIKLFKQIQETSGSNDKKAIISANKDNELFKRCLAFLLNPNIITGLSDKKLNKEVEMTKHIDITCDFESIMDYLETNNSGRDSDISIVQGFIMAQPEEHREFYSQMVTKKFRLGIDVKGVNKAIPNLIPTWEVQQAYPLADKNEPKDG